MKGNKIIKWVLTSIKFLLETTLLDLESKTLSKFLENSNLTVNTMEYLQ